ncbi:MAG TPA: tetratricopeptide repeat protein [Trichormus sp.]|jgi:tetratricopeptide (TPR) repeat protein
MQDHTTQTGEHQTVADEIRLGELLLQLGMLQRKELEEALQIVDQTGLGLGRVLVLSQHINEKILDAAIQCQSMLRSNRIDIPSAKIAIQGVATGKHRNFEEALSAAGHQSTRDESSNRLGDLLVEAGLVTKAQLQSAVAQTDETGLPFGRLLVLSGVLTEAAMTSALNAQSALLAGKVTKEQAINSLRSNARRSVMRAENAPAPTERDFYQLPDRKSVLLGELLVSAGSISKAQLSNAIELSVSNGTWLGQVLQELKLISEPVLKRTLELQDMVMANQLSAADATKVLFLVDREGLSVNSAMSRVKMPVIGADPALKAAPGNRKLTFIEFLKLLGVVDDDGITKAWNMGRDHPQIMMQVLLFANVCDPNYLHLASSCNAMMETGRLSVEHAFVLFDYARKKRVNIDQALKELNWGQGDMPTALATANADTEWEALRRHAEQAMQESHLEDAEQQWLEVVKRAEQLGGKEGPRFVCSIERLGDVYTKLGRLAQAESLYSEALVTKTRVLPPHSLHTAASVNNMAKISYFQGKYDNAERFALRFLEMYKANFPDDHPDVACALQNVATLYHMQEKFNKAEPYYGEALRICKGKLGDQHPTTVRMQQNYSRLLQSMRKFREGDKDDVKAMGSVTGSWKAVTVPSDHLLYNYSDRLTED